MKNKYLVLLQFAPHRDTWRLIDMYKELNLTLILFGGPCTEAKIQELFAQADYIMEWYKYETYNKRPIIYTTDLSTKFIAHVFISTSMEKEPVWDALVESWWQLRKPASWTAQTFSSMANHYNININSQRQEGQSQGQSQSRYSTATMSLQKACKLLGISEAQCTDTALVQKMFRKEAIKYHPDKFSGSGEKERADALNVFKELAEAKSFLLKES
jgi:hypothetical protein